MFEQGNIDPMLIGSEKPPFDSKEYIYELKMDGVRCIAYFDKNYVELRNKRHMALLNKFPELANINNFVKKKCILDGELYVFKEGANDFFAVQKRCLTSDPFKIRLASKDSPATFTAFDILYLDGEDLTRKTLLERKKILSKIIKENTYINISRYVENQGIALFQLTADKGLEGIVAKKKTSLYHIGQRTKEWIKSKNFIDEDFVILGYIRKEHNMMSLILAQYDNKKLVYKGHVTLGVSLTYLNQHSSRVNKMPLKNISEGNEEAIWISPFLVGTVKFMEYTEKGGMRQPVFKGFREDKLPKECIVKE